jgi:hypothetical protein
MNINDPFTPPEVPGVYDIPDSAYHSGIGFSSSGLKLFTQSPLHYWSAYLDDQREPKPETPALINGKLIHMAVLEPEKYFATIYALPDKIDRRTKEGKAEFDFHERKAAEENRQIITAEQHLRCQRIAEAVRNNAASDFLFSGEGWIERSFYWRDLATGVLCKCRPDKFLTSMNIILDLKSCEDASYNGFQKSISNYNYGLSAAWYCRGLEAVLGKRPEQFILAAFEKDPPYACAFYVLDSEYMRRADQIIHFNLQLFAECQRTGQWPGYPDQIQTIEIPRWLRTA